MIGLFLLCGHTSDEFMNRQVKIIRFLVGALILVTLCGAFSTLSVLALFLQTFFALTREIPVAEVVMSPIQSDAQGEYIEIEFTPYTNQSALLEIFNPKTSELTEKPQLGKSQIYKVYGDTVAVRGPFIKLHPGLLILNFENVYKLSLIEGEYRRSRGSTSEGSEYIINGGFEDFWWDFNNQEASFPYNVIVDRVTFSGDEEPGFRGTGKKRYQIVVTMDTLTWNFIENVQG